MEVIAGLLLAAGILLLVGGVLAGEPAAPALGAALAAGAVVLELTAGRLAEPAAVAIAVGVVLLLAELAVGSGVAGVLGGAAVVGALLFGWEGGAGLATVGLTLLVGIGLLVRRTRQHEGMLLGAGLRAGSGRVRTEPPVAPTTVGTAVTALRPGGTARFDGQDLEVHLDVGTAEPGDRLVALRVVDGVLVVTREVPPADHDA